jgi:hypothetical protein
MRAEKREKKGTDWVVGERSKAKKASVEDKIEEKMVVWVS